MKFRYIQLLSIFVNPGKPVKIITCLLVSLWALKLRFERYAGRPLWNDEFYQINFMTGPFQPFWERRVYGDFTCFPGDYLLSYPFLRFFGLHNIHNAFTTTFTDFEKWVLAVPHILSTIIGFVLLYLVCSRYFKTLIGFIVAFGIVCFNGQLIFHSFEFRPYGVLPTLALAAFYLTDRVMRGKSGNKLYSKILIGFFLVIIILFHAYGILMVFFLGLFSLLKGRGSYFPDAAMRDSLKFFGAVFITAFPLWIWYATGNPMGVLESSTQFDTFQYIANPLVNWTAFIKSIFGNLIGYKKFYILLLSMVIALFASYKEKTNQFMFFLVVIVIPIEIIFLIDLFKGYMFLQRQFVWTMPLFAFFLAWQWDSLLTVLSARDSNKNKTPGMD